MERTTKKKVIEIYEMFRDLMGKVETTWEPKDDGPGLKVNEGSWRLDHQPTYGGYRIDESGGASCPFGYTRMKPREFVDAVRMAKSAAYQNRNKRPVYGVAYWAEDKPEIFLFDDEDRADIKHQEIMKRENYSEEYDRISRFTEYVV